MNFNRFYLLCVSATLLTLSLISCTGLAEVSAVPYYLAIDNLYDEGQFDDFAGATATPEGWENVYSQTLLENGTFDTNIDDWYTYFSLNFWSSGRLRSETTRVGSFGALQPQVIPDDHYIYINYEVWSGDVVEERPFYRHDGGYQYFDTQYLTSGYLNYSSIEVLDEDTNYDGFNTKANALYITDVVEYDNFTLLDLTDLFTQTSGYNLTRLNSGLADSDTYLMAGTIDWWDDNTALEFMDYSWERYNYDLSTQVVEGDIVYISYDYKAKADAEYTCFSSDCFWPSGMSERHRGFTEIADANYQLSISNFEGVGYDTTWIAFDNIMVFNLTSLFGSGEEPTTLEFETDYLSKMPEWFETYNFLLADVLVANEGDLVVGTVAKDDFLTDYSYMYLAYKQPYSTINILATEDDIIDDCVAEFLFQGDWFDLDANLDTCALNFDNANYDTLLSLLQDGVVKSDLTNDSYFSIKYANNDYTERTTQILISFDEVVQSVRTVIIAFADSTDINDFNKVAFQFKYDDFVVGWQENAITYLWQENVIILTIYNSLLKYDSLDIFIQQTSASPDTQLGLTELAFLKDTLVSTPTGTRNIDAESDFLLDFQFEYDSCGTWDFGCKIKNSMIWLTVESPPAVTMWDKYGELSNQIYDITRIQNDFIDVLDQTGIQAGIGAVLTLFTALFSIMIYSLLSKFFR